METAWEKFESNFHLSEIKMGYNFKLRVSLNIFQYGNNFFNFQNSYQIKSQDYSGSCFSVNF